MAKKPTKSTPKTAAKSSEKPPQKVKEKKPEPAPESQELSPLESLRSEVDRLFEDFGSGFSRFPFGRSALEIEPIWKRELSWKGVPAVDIVEKDKAFEFTAELPGMTEADVEVKVANGGLVIKGEKTEQTEEEKTGYHLQERRYGSFERRFRLPDGVDPDGIEAHFKNGILTVTLPKTEEAQKSEKTIAIKSS